MANIKKGDTVEVITGVHKGERGEVKRVDGKDGRVVVHNVNMVKKHQKPMQGGRASRTQVGIIEFEAPINLSNVLLVCPKCSEAVRVSVRLDGSDKVRVCKNCGADIK